MNQGVSTEEAPKPFALVVGGHSPIAVETTKALSEDHRVVHVTRSISDNLISEFGDEYDVEIVEADLTLNRAGSKLVESLVSSGHYPSSIAFLQRYRASSGEANFGQHMSVEIWGVREILEAYARLKPPELYVNSVVATSPAATKVVRDQNLDYHLVKAGQEALVRFLSVTQAPHNMNIFAAQIGSIVVKTRAEVYWTTHAEQLHLLGELSPLKSLPTQLTIGKQLASLLRVSNSSLSGQTIPLDGMFSILDGPQSHKLLLTWTQVP